MLLSCKANRPQFFYNFSPVIECLQYSKYHNKWIIKNDWHRFFNVRRNANDQFIFEQSIPKFNFNNRCDDD